MKKVAIICLAFCTLALGVCAQETEDKDGENDDYKLDLLQAPASPAANLIGTAPTEVQTFTDPTAFMVSLQNGAKNFDGFPKSYAVDIAPAWLFWGKKISYANFSSNKTWDNIKQSFVVSFAYTNTDSVIKQTDMGIGFKVSLIRGHVNHKAGTLIGQSDTLLAKITNTYAANFKGSTEDDQLMKVLEEQGIAIAKEIDTITNLAQKRLLEGKQSEILAKLTLRSEELADIAKEKVIEQYKAEFDSLKSITEKIDFKRVGFKVDVAGGTALRFPGQIFNYSILSRAGVWLTAGWDWDNGLTAMGILRYMHNPDKLYYDGDNNLYAVSNLDIGDGGARLQYEGKDGKFLFGGEIIYRSVLNPQGVAPAWRYIVNCDYQVKKNTHLTLTLGRDFDGTFNKDGNLTAALNLVFGLGNTLDFDGK